MMVSPAFFACEKQKLSMKPAQKNISSMVSPDQKSWHGKSNNIPGPPFL
jgi:hypothetical protein